MADKLAQLIAARSRWLGIVCLASVVVPIYLLKDAKIDNSTEVWLGSERREHGEYRQFLDKYGNEEFVVVAAASENVFGAECLGFQQRLAERLMDVAEVDNVLSIAQVAELLRQFRPDWEKLLRENDLFRGLLLGQDGRTYGLVVWLDRIDDPTKRKVAIEKIEAVVAATAGQDVAVHLAGTPLMNIALDRGSLSTYRGFLPAAVVISLIILAFELRSFTTVLAVMASVGVTTLWTLGALVGLGRTLNMITVAMPSVLFVLALSGGIHITARFQTLLAALGGRSAAVRGALADVMGPVFLSNVTTAIGFGSLLMSNMEPVAEFGVCTAFGIMLSFVFNVTIIPGLLCLLHPHRPPQRRARLHWTVGIGQGVIRIKGRMLLAAVGVFLVSIALTTQARVEFNVLNFFPADSKIRRDYEFIGNNLTGLYTVEVDASIDSQKGTALMKDIERLGEQIAGQSGVAKVIHYGQVARPFKNIPRPVFMRPGAARDNPLKKLSNSYLHKGDDDISLRMSVLARAMSSGGFYSLVDMIEAKAV